MFIADDALARLGFLSTDSFSYPVRAVSAAFDTRFTAGVKTSVGSLTEGGRSASIRIDSANASSNFQDGRCLSKAIVSSTLRRSFSTLRSWSPYQKSIVAFSEFWMASVSR